MAHVDFAGQRRIFLLPYDAVKTPCAVNNKSEQIPPTKARVRKHLGADALLRKLGDCFHKVKDRRPGDPEITLSDALLSGYAVFLLKDPSLLAFDRRRKEEPHNLKTIFHIGKIPSDTQMRSILDEVNPEDLNCCFKSVFSSLQRGKVLDQMQYLDDHYLLLMDGTQYFASEKLKSPFCMEKTNSATGATTYYLPDPWGSTRSSRPQGGNSSHAGADLQAGRRNQE